MFRRHAAFSFVCLSGVFGFVRDKRAEREKAMSKLHDLIDKVSDPALKSAILEECRKLEKGKKFGLVFEDHLPEATPLYGLEIKVGMTVATREQDGGALFKVLSIENDKAICLPLAIGIGARRQEAANEFKGYETFTFALSEIVAVATFGEAIYPYLEPIASIEHGGGELWHTLIQADNYHALQLLEYLYAGKVDCIYIDPPYNTGAKDWKYNNDYVDGNDAWRHSKWLSMMEKRLKLAKKLLNPKDSVLIVTIDEKEYLHLGMLLEQLFPEARMQMISTVINPAGVSRHGTFARVDEYVYIIQIGASEVCRLDLNDEWRLRPNDKRAMRLRWNTLIRTGTNALRVDRKNLFYPIYVYKDGHAIHSVGEPFYGEDRNEVIAPIDTVAIWPIRSSGDEGNWQISNNVLRDLLKKGYVHLGRFTENGMAISYLKKGEIEKIESGTFEISGYSDDGAVISNTEAVSIIPGTQWRITSHDATLNGTKFLNSIVGEKRFSFPKSIYAVHDVIRLFVANKPNALILDFFAGSGTTLHAVNLLNEEDGGKRRCIMVTNNEVSEVEAKEFQKKGLRPGDKEWEAKGIAQYVTWPRTVCSIKGENVKGEPLKGEYLGGDKENPLKMADGFKANAAFFKLGFLNPGAVALGKKFKEMLPVLWMKAGAHGACPEIAADVRDNGFVVWPENRMAVLFDEASFARFGKVIREAKTVETIFVETDYEPSYRAVVEAFPKHRVYSLYGDYLTSFRVNVKKG